MLPTWWGLNPQPRDHPQSNRTTEAGSISRVSGQFLLVLCFLEIPVVNANSVYSDLRPHSAASDLGLHSLPITHLGVSRLKWGREDTVISQAKVLTVALMNTLIWHAHN